MAVKFISIQQIADRYGYSYNAVKKWVQEGMPLDEAKNKAPEKEATEWILINKINPLREVSVKEEMDLERLREQKAKADLAQYAAQEKSGELISTDYVQSELNKFCSNLKDTLRLIPSKHAIDLIEHADSVDDLKQRLREIIDEELLKVSELFEQENIIQETDQDESEQPEQDLIDIDID
ncbi:hypothetical protein [Klebsiella pneumoniae]|uniref:hypothetical protein n=1 Tax=Klebsiella pneumoniae TaxID=573 RepID=UPI001CA5E3AA|nr:hypothetical protein [Klebsiella pneumoniae]MBW6026271.1 hypothetical protein [Klebsiella pneumoniae]MBX4527621.1 hypothetical protein [Klebsiella pneumoniae]